VVVVVDVDDVVVVVLVVVDDEPSTWHPRPSVSRTCPGLHTHPCCVRTSPVAQMLTGGS
jgi:hypothetical protein